jgi:hypothetical protein
MFKTKMMTVAALLLMSGVAVADLNTGLVAHWSFDDCTAKDVSGNGNDGNKYGSQCVQGRMGNALDFNGISDYVEVPSNSKLSNSDSLTLSAWIYKTSGLNDYQGIITKWYQYTPNSTSEINQDTYGLYITESVSANTNNYFYGSNAVIDTDKAPLNQWIHVVFTHSNINGGKLYINGILKGTTSTGGNIVPSSNPVILGADNNAGTIWRFFQGKIDEARIYNRTLTAAEITVLYNQSNPIQGTAPWKTTHTVTCQNITKNTSLIIPKTKAKAWDCEKAGLKAQSGDKVKVTIEGTKY